MLAISAYVNADGTEAAIVHVHADAGSMEEYWRVVHAHPGRAFGQFVERTTSVQAYGATSDVDLERTRHAARSGVAVGVMPEHLGGFTRLAPGTDPTSHAGEQAIDRVAIDGQVHGRIRGREVS